MQKEITIATLVLLICIIIVSTTISKRVEPETFCDYEYMGKNYKIEGSNYPSNDFWNSLGRAFGKGSSSSIWHKEIEYDYRNNRETCLKYCANDPNCNTIQLSTNKCYMLGKGAKIRVINCNYEYCPDTMYSKNKNLIVFT